MSSKQPVPHSSPGSSHLSEDLLPRLILDYLSHNGYADTARAFMSIPLHASSSSSTSYSVTASTFSNKSTSASNGNGLALGTSFSAGPEDDDIMMSSVADMSVTPRASNGFGGLGNNSNDAASSASLMGFGFASRETSIHAGVGPLGRGMDIDTEAGEEEEDKRVEGMLFVEGSNPLGGRDRISASSNGSGSGLGNGHGKGKGKDNDGSNIGGLAGEAEEKIQEMIAQIEARGLIRHYICTNNIPSAIQTIQTHFPSVIRQDPPSSPMKTQTNGNDPIVDGTAGMVATANENEGNKTIPSKTLKPLSGRGPAHPFYKISSYPDVSSLDAPLPFKESHSNPVHLFLNLQLQGLVNDVRNMIIPNSPSSSMASSFHSDAGMAIGLGGIGPPMNGLTSQAIAIKGAENTSPTLVSNGFHNANGNGKVADPVNDVKSVVERAQGLYERVRAMQPEERDVYTRAIDDIAGLLAYEDMENSPLSGYLEQGRRDALAKQVDSSITVSLGYRSTALLDTMVRQISQLWGKMQDGEMDLVPDFTEVKDGFAASLLAKNLKYKGWHGIQALIADGQ